MRKPERARSGSTAACTAAAPTFVCEPAAALARPVLLGDGIENPGNAAALQEAAALFHWDCGFLGEDDALPGIQALPRTQAAAACSPLIALENVEDADDVYGFQPPPGARLGLVVGNERKGITRGVLDAAYQTVRIPVASRQINTLNVAAAAAIALYYLSRGGKGRLRTRPDPGRSRPELLLSGPTDAIELGSVLRSAAAFGWERAHVQDAHGVWFGTDRVTRSLGRGAARRARNGIHVLPAELAARTGRFDEVCIVTAAEGEPIERADLARGPGQLVVLADESGGADAAAALGRLARKVRYVRLGLPAPSAGYRFRLVASIALAEVARQVGIRPRPQRGRKVQDAAHAASGYRADEEGLF